VRQATRDIAGVDHGAAQAYRGGAYGIRRGPVRRNLRHRPLEPRGDYLDVSIPRESNKEHAHNQTRSEGIIHAMKEEPQEGSKGEATDTSAVVEGITEGRRKSSRGRARKSRGRRKRGLKEEKQIVVGWSGSTARVTWQEPRGVDVWNKNVQPTERGKPSEKKLGKKNSGQMRLTRPER